LASSCDRTKGRSSSRAVERFAPSRPGSQAQLAGQLTLHLGFIRYKAVMVDKTAARRQRRARRWRERLRRGAAVYPVEVDGATFDLMERFGGLSSDKVDDNTRHFDPGRPWARAARLFQAEASRGSEMLAFGTNQRVHDRFLRRRRSGGAVINVAHSCRYLSGAGGIRLPRLQGWWPWPRSDVRASATAARVIPGTSLR
jgi:hypothetical protein